MLFIVMLLFIIGYTCLLLNNKRRYFLPFLVVVFYVLFNYQWYLDKESYKIEPGLGGKMSIGLNDTYVGGYQGYLRIEPKKEESGIKEGPSTKCEEDVCVGQCWTIKDKNPFRKQDAIVYKVLDIKDGYVKFAYIDENGKEYGEGSYGISIFKLGAKQISSFPEK